MHSLKHFLTYIRVAENRNTVCQKQEKNAENRNKKNVCIIANISNKMSLKWQIKNSLSYYDSLSIKITSLSLRIINIINVTAIFVNLLHQPAENRYIYLTQLNELMHIVRINIHQKFYRSFQVCFECKNCYRVFQATF